MTPTKKNHINPCFWTALWNVNYYNNFINDSTTERAREQKVFCLDFIVPKILQRKVEDVHYIERMGLTFVNDEELFQLENIHSPETKSPFDKTKLNPSNQEGNHIIDIENHFSVLEEIGGYKQLLKTIRDNKINSNEDRIYLACFLIIHQIRGIKFFQRLYLKHKDELNPRLKAFLNFKEIISNTDKLYETVNPIVKAKWTLYITKEFFFPLSDSPIIYYENFIWVVLSPKHFLEIDRSKEFAGSVKYKNEIDKNKFSLIRKQIIRNSFQSIIFCNKELLEKWRKSKAWHFRKKFLEK